MVVRRCANCGAPLEGASGAAMVACLYCRAENHAAYDGHGLAKRVARFQLAAGEAQELAKANEARSEALMAEFQALATRAHQGDRGAARQALVAMEGFMRLQYAPTIHLYNSWDPADPTVVAAMKQIDDAIGDALKATAESLGVER